MASEQQCQHDDDNQQAAKQRIDYSGHHGAHCRAHLNQAAVRELLEMELCPHSSVTVLWRIGAPAGCVRGRRALRCTFPEDSAQPQRQEEEDEAGGEPFDKQKELSAWQPLHVPTVDSKATPRPRRTLR